MFAIGLAFVLALLVAASARRQLTLRGGLVLAVLIGAGLASAAAAVLAASVSMPLLLAAGSGAILGALLVKPV